MKNSPCVPLSFLAVVVLALPSLKIKAADTPPLFDQKNIVAWCIVPFDSVKRGPAERAEMIQKLGITQVAYDWREEHVSQFEQEILEYQKRGIEFFAFWGAHEEAFRLFEKYNLHPQIWQTAPSPTGTATRNEQIQKAAMQLLPMVDRTRKLGCQLGLYNHGGWGGEPENLVAVCEYLHRHHDAKHVGIVYNQHHGHSHVEHFSKDLAAMKPYLLCLNLNGMIRDGDKRDMKIQPVGQGEMDLSLLKNISESGYRGPIGIIGHTNDDVELRLRDNLDGLNWLVPQLSGKPADTKPTPRLPLFPKAVVPANTK